MIPVIGIMIALYIITRMLQVVVQQNPKAHSAVALSALVTLIAALIGIAILILQSEEVRKALPPELR